MTKRTIDQLMVLTLLGALTLTASATVRYATPEAGSAGMLLGCALVGLASVRRFFRKH
jgi:hypothetical protein